MVYKVFQCAIFKKVFHVSSLYISLFFSQKILAIKIFTSSKKEFKFVFYHHNFQCYTDTNGLSIKGLIQCAVASRCNGANLILELMDGQKEFQHHFQYSHKLFSGFLSTQTRLPASSRAHPLTCKERQKLTAIEGRKRKN
jgi:hypothetical protein